MNERGNLKLKKLAAALAVLLLIVSVLPIALMGRYDYPSADDYSGALGAAAILRDGGSVGDVILFALKSVGEIYRDWQGNYTCSFLLNVSPALWGDAAYFLVAAAIMAALCGATFFLVSSVVRKILGGEGYDAVIVSCVVSFMSIQFMPSPVEGIFWYAGAATYTFTYSLALLALGFSVRYLYGERRSPLTLAVAVIFILLTGGANTQTSFITVGVYLLYFIWTLACDRSRAKPAGLFLALSAAGFAVLMLSPGNALRVEFFGLQGIRRDLFNVIFCAFKDGALLLRHSLGIGLALCLLALAPSLWRLAQKTSFRFRLPLAFVLFAYCFLSAGFAPITYSYGEAAAAPGRYQNLQYFLLCWLLVLCEFYVFGWAQRSGKLNSALAKARKLLSKRALRTAALAVVVCGALAWAFTSGSFTAKTALVSLSDGSAAAYGAQMQALVDQCRDPDVDIPTSAPFTIRPILLWHSGPTTEGIWVNDVMGSFYGKKTVVISDGTAQ